MIVFWRLTMIKENEKGQQIVNQSVWYMQSPKWEEYFPWIIPIPYILTGILPST